MMVKIIKVKKQKHNEIMYIFGMLFELQIALDNRTFINYNITYHDVIQVNKLKIRSENS